MATLASMTLRLAKKITPVRESTATDGSYTYLSDSLMEGMGDYKGGVLWVLSGTHINKSREITSNPKDKFVFATLGGIPCVKQVETATVAGTVTGDGNATVIVTAANMDGSPVTVSVAVLNGDTASAVGGKIRTALAADATVGDFFTVSGSTTSVVLTVKSARANDATLNISIANGTCTGLTAAPTSANTTAGVVGPLYAVASNKVRRDLLQSAVNQALRLVKSRLTEDDSTLTVDSEVDEYDLPDDVDVLLKVEIATSDEEPYGYCEDRHWVHDILNGKLRFAADFAPQIDGRKIRLTYRAAHSNTTDETTSLSLTPDEEEGAYWRGLIELISSLITLRPEGLDGKRLADLFQEAQVEWGRWKMKNVTPQRHGQLANW